MDVFDLGSSTWGALALVGGVGAITGLLGGFIGSADNLLGAILMGIIGAIALSTVLLMAGVTPIYAAPGTDFSLVWGALGGLILGFVVGRSN